MKIPFLFIAGFLALSSVSSPNWSRADAEKDQLQIVTDFYRCYLDYTKSKHSPGLNAEKQCSSEKPFFSLDAQKLLTSDRDACKSQSRGEVCGFGADGGPYLDAQDFDENMSFKKSKFKGQKISEDLVEVKFRLFPNDPKNPGLRRIHFKMVKDPQGWRVDDIIYKSNGDSSMRKQIKVEMEELKKSHASAQ